MEKLALARFQYFLDCDYPELRISKDSPGSETMDPTTLVTFLFRAPAEARTVELLGSWDNFTQAYSMYHDRRRGTGFWSGCFKFHDIVYDGDSPDWNSKPRTGGLKQGGTYWYYYRLNDHVETYDRQRDVTTDCPLLPGQTTNVMEVPREIMEVPTRRRSVSMDGVGALASVPNTHTLEPSDKFSILHPPPVSRVHGRCVSDFELHRRLESIPPPPIHSLFQSRLAAASSKSQRPILGRGHPSGRYYSDNAYVDDRSSVDSRRSWCSTAPSFAHSSVVDAFGIESPTVEEDPSPLLPCLAIEKPRSGSADVGADEKSNNIDFKPPHEHDDGSSLYSNELDADAGAEPITDNVQSRSLLDPFFVDNALPPSSHAPASIRDVQMYGSLPASSHSVQERRPRHYSLPSTDSRRHVIANSTPVYPSSASEAAEHERPAEIGNYMLETAISIPHSSAHEDSADIRSPTFSAATISSGGLNTPFRLSVNDSRNASVYASPIANHCADEENSLESVAERLRNLGVEEERGVPTTIKENNAPPAMFKVYSLPESETVRNDQSLSKLSNAHTGIAQGLSLPSLDLLRSGNEDSFAESIFGELGCMSKRIRSA